MTLPYQLPIDHPDYRYPESRNPYSAKLDALQATGRVFYDNSTEGKAGRWRKKSGQLHVELGCNAGHVLVEWAHRDPLNFYIGIDWKFKAIHRAHEKAVKKSAANATFLRARSERLRYIFAPGEIDRLYLFFPDPWAKKSQWKHRFITVESLRWIAPLLPKGGTFLIKTDHAGYFDWMETAVSEVPELWKVNRRSADLHAGNREAEKLDFPEVTVFEKLFIKKGLPIHLLELERL